MKILSFAHKGLKRFCAEDNAKGVPADTVDKLRKMSVTGNRRLTFRITFRIDETSAKFAT